MGDLTAVPLNARIIEIVWIKIFFFATIALIIQSFNMMV